jgi:hypothetical protein
MKAQALNVRLCALNIGTVQVVGVLFSNSFFLLVPEVFK